MLPFAGALAKPLVRYGLAALAVCALVGGLLYWHHSVATGAIQAALDGQRAELQRKTEQTVAAVKLQHLEENNRASIALLELTYAQSKMLDKARDDAAASRGALQRLQHTLSALRRGGAAPGPGGEAGQVADATGALADSLYDCGERYAGVAEGFDRLSIQVTGLQAYITDVVGPVCLAGE